MAALRFVLLLVVALAAAEGEKKEVPPPPKPIAEMDEADSEAYLTQLQDAGLSTDEIMQHFKDIGVMDNIAPRGSIGDQVDSIVENKTRVSKGISNMREAMKTKIPKYKEAWDQLYKNPKNKKKAKSKGR